MKPSVSRPLAALWIVATIGLPAMLVYGSIRTYDALEQQRDVYLRSRAAAIATRLETLPAGLSKAQAAATMEDEPDLLDLVILDPPVRLDGDPFAGLWQGRELFRTAHVENAGQQVFRAVVPFHSPDGTRLARIDLAASSADFLVRDAGRHRWLVAIGSAVIVALSLLAVWNLRRAGEVERRQLELEHLAHIGTMSAVLAHEIRNPLGTIKGFAQLLAEQSAPAERRLIDPIIRETLRLESLVKDLLLYGRPAQPDLREVSALAVADSLAAHTPGAPVFEANVADVTFLTDPNLLQQALLNLVRNALEAVEGTSGGLVRLEGEAAETEFVWRVSDNGPGLSEEARARLLEPFFTSKAFGTGLGLSITSKLAGALGGRFMIANRPQGGVEAQIRLPRA